LSLERHWLGKPNAVVSAEATSKRCNGLARRFPRGLRNDGTRAKGSPRNLGAPMFSVVESRKGHRPEKVQACRRQVSHPPAGANRGAPSRYRRVKATKRGGKGHGESECFESTCEAGERPRDPVEGRGAPGHGTAGVTGRSDTDPRSGLDATPADSVAPRTRYPDEPDASTRTSGSVGGPGGATTRAHPASRRKRWSFAADPRCWADREE
jgi:hypothetical protein